MAKIHIKGFILQLLHRQPDIWDYDIADIVMREYNYSDRTYWLGAIRVSLAELDAGGLVQQVDDQVSGSTGRVQFQYRISKFGERRMRDTGLLPA